MFANASDIIAQESTTAADQNSEQITDRPLQDISHLVLNIDEENGPTPMLPIVDPLADHTNSSHPIPIAQASNAMTFGEFWEDFDFSAFTGLSDSDDSTSVPTEPK